jgi:hypothetical protein
MGKFKTKDSGSDLEELKKEVVMDEHRVSKNQKINNYAKII